MDKEKMIELFDQYLNSPDNELREDEKPSQRSDLCAFLRLDKLLPGDMDMVAAGEHDMIYLEPDLDELAAVITEDDIRYLAACGVHYDDTDSLAMFV